MSASDEGGSSSNAIGLGAEAIDGIVKSLALPRALVADAAKPVAAARSA
jgi:hypothetical protein